MCELFGLSCNKPVSVNFTWRGFVSRGVNYEDGWGIAFYPEERSLCLIKEPKITVKSPMVSFLKSTEFVKGKIVISHVRKASVGVAAYRNTHPFARELFGREWAFAHNGTINVKKLPDPKFYEPVGETDSEKAFCLILDHLRDLGRKASIYEKAKCIENIALDFSEYGDFNFLMSDGEHLYAFHSGSSLYYNIRFPPHRSRVKLHDEDFEVNLGEIKSEDEIATIIATEKLTDETWIEFPEKKLMVFKDGLPYFSEEQLIVLRYIRKSPHSVSIEDLSKIGIDPEIIRNCLIELRDMKILKQKNRIKGPVFYTNPKLRDLIDKILIHLNK